MFITDISVPLSVWEFLVSGMVYCASVLLILNCVAGILSTLTVVINVMLKYTYLFSYWD